MAGVRLGHVTEPAGSSLGHAITASDRGCSLRLCGNRLRLRTEALYRTASDRGAVNDGLGQRRSK